MNRHLLSSSALHDFSDNSFARRASLAGSQIMHGKKRPKIEINLEEQPPGFHVPSYTTLDRIHGHATITAPSDLTFDDIHITLQGTSRTWVEKIATTAPTNPRTRAFHTFLRLMQPIEESDVPEQNILRAGRTYKLPFEFVIPERLLPQSCSHSRSNAQVEEEHLKLPASLGDAMVSGDGKSLQCDFAPEMTTITYSIKVVITKKARGEQTRPAIVGEHSLKLRIIPKVDEVPPLEITDDPGEDYIMKKCKNIKKGLLMGKTKIGTLVVETRQPAPLRLPDVRCAARDDVSSVMTMVTLRLRFDPAKANTKPPKLQMLWSRLKIATFFSTIPQKTLPSKSAAYSMDQNKGLMVDTLALSSRCLGGQGWKHNVCERRDSAIAFPIDQPESPDLELNEPPLHGSTLRSTSPSPATTPILEEGPSGTGEYYTADVLVPIELPYRKFALVPTFHSCLVSRVYALDMSLAVSTGTGNSPSVHLKIPVQVTSPGSDRPVMAEASPTAAAAVVGSHDERHGLVGSLAAIPDSPPDFDDVPSLGGRRATYDLGTLGRGFSAQGEQAVSNVDSEGEPGMRRPVWTDLSAMRDTVPTGSYSEAHRGSIDARGLVDSGLDVLRAVSPAARSASPRTARITNDEILNTEDYESPPSTEEQFGGFRWNSSTSLQPTEGRGRGSIADTRRNTENLPPGYSSVAAGVMLMGTGGMVRALS